MSEIKRYDVSLVKGPGYSEMQIEQDDHGLWVRHEDHLAAVEAQAEEIATLRDALAQKVLSDTMLTGQTAGRGGAILTLEGGACSLLADAFADQLFNSKAENYIEVTFESSKHPGLGVIAVTVQRVTGKTPHQLRREAEAAVEAAVMAERASCVEACLAVQRTSAYPEEASGAEDCADAIRARTTQPAKEAG